MKAAPQQINLYQPIFRVERKLFSAQAMLYALAILVAGLAVVWTFSWRRVASIEAEVAQLKVAEQARVTMTARQGELNPAASLTDLERRSAGYVVELAAVRRALELARSNGNVPGFADRLQALGAPPVPELWLDRIVLGNAGVALRGSATDPAAVPRYLVELGRLTAFTGSTFDRMALARPVEGRRATVHFEIGSEAALAAAEAHDSVMAPAESKP